MLGQFNNPLGQPTWGKWVGPFTSFFNLFFKLKFLLDPKKKEQNKTKDEIKFLNIINPKYN